MSQTEDWIVQPERFVRYLREIEGLSASEVRLPARGILVFGGGDFRMFCRALRARVLRWNEWLGVGKIGRKRAVVFRATVGAPAAAISLEEAIALGLRSVIAFGACRSLVKDLRIGSVVLPNKAFSEEGTSHHYGGKRWTTPDAALIRALRQACEGRDISLREGATWTTDAPYREGRARVKALVRRGIVSVEMEASALWQVARVRRVRIASLFVVSDELDGPEWNAGFNNPQFKAAKQRAVGAVVDALRGSGS